MACNKKTFIKPTRGEFASAALVLAVTAFGVISTIRELRFIHKGRIIQELYPKEYEYYATKAHQSRLDYFYHRDAVNPQLDYKTARADAIKHERAFRDWQRSQIRNMQKAGRDRR